MKTFKTIFTLTCLLMLLSCNNDDESNPSVRESLTSGRWYFESMSLSPLNDCEKNTFIEFFQNGNAYTESYNLNTENVCEITLVNSGSFELVSDSQLSITYGTETNSSLVIVQISDSQLILRDESGSEHNTITFDKTQG